MRTLIWVLLAVALAGCGQEQTLGEKLKAECESVVKAAYSAEWLAWTSNRDRAVQDCVWKRGTAQK